MKLFAKQVLLASGWRESQILTIENGIIRSIETGNANDADQVKGTVIPGMVNCHSHAFQRAFAGFSEQGSDSQDSFWTWRKVMYEFLAQLSVEDARIIARQLYIEMLKKGYTRVAEFHYLHHDVNGQPYDELAAMAKAIFNAAQETGIGLTMLPVLYCFSGFGAQPANDGQKRFINTTDQFNQLVTECFQLSEQYSNTNVGIAPHSLRAVNKTSLESAVQHLKSLDKLAPVHIHIAEQQKEVQDSIAFSGERPVQWLLNNTKVDQHWCLIHATHINEQERQGMIEKGAIAGICPTTEANLGDGIFPTQEFLAEGGIFAIGSDSHISVDPVEELRWLEYAQRLSKQQRAVLSTADNQSVGSYLWQSAAKGGAQSTSSNVGEISVGKQADLIVLDDKHMALFANQPKYLLDSFIFASQNVAVQDVMVAGQWRVEGGVHACENDSAGAYTELLAKLAATV